jgi:Galactose oxidase-like, Early set domain/Glyoxal oxidase N-terminus
VLLAGVFVLALAACVPVTPTNGPPPGGGSASPPPPPGTPDPRAGTGEWSAPASSGGSIMQHAALIPNSSRIVFFEDGAGASVLDPTTGQVEVEPAGSNLFCAGQTVLADGRIMVLGGDAAGDPQYGSVATNIYNPATDSWSFAAPMHSVRWYPTGTKLPDGRILATGGTSSGVTQQTPEIYNPVNNTWTLMATTANLDIAYYPFMFVLPDGRLLEAGSFNLGGVPVKTLNLATQTWSTVDGRAIAAGSATMYRPGKILRTGTPGGPGTASQTASTAAYTLDMTSASPSLLPTGSMANPRAFLNLTTLPDGNVLATGGDRTHDITNLNGAVYTAEEWSPSTGRWTTLASNHVPRYYHSTAVLLPDARVVVGGGWGGAGGDGVRQRTYEIFSPPYLFKGARPTITGAPAATGYGARFHVSTPDAASITSAVLIAPSAPTHNFNENARYVPMAFGASGDGLQLTAPPNANYAPPGAYMLFLVNANGVPSIASWIDIG